MAEPQGSVRELGERLGAEDRTVQRLACDEALARLEEDPALQRDLLRILDGGTHRARFAAAFVLFRARRPTLRLLPALLEALGFQDGDLRWSAAHMLTDLGRLQGEVFPVLLNEARTSEDAARRRMSFYVLRELGPERAETRGALLEGLDDPDPDVRRAALSSLAKVLEPDETCVARVLEILKADRDPRMRRIAAVLLPDLLALHPGSRSQARALLSDAARTDDLSLRRAIESALERLAD